MKSVVIEGVARVKEYMEDSDCMVGFRTEYDKARAYIAGCHDSGGMSTEEWAREAGEIKTLFLNLADTHAKRYYNL
jgi:hypothetical protein